MSKSVVNWLFGLFFNLLAAGLIIGLLMVPGALLGNLESVWLGRTGIVLQMLGISLLALEYLGVAQEGESPLRWWLRRLPSVTDDSAPNLWPRQLLLVMGAGAVLIGLLLQLAGSIV